MVFSLNNSLSLSVLSRVSSLSCSVKRILHTPPFWATPFNQHFFSTAEVLVSTIAAKRCVSTPNTSESRLQHSKVVQSTHSLWEERAEMRQDTARASSCLQHSACWCSRGQNGNLPKPGACGSTKPSRNCSICWDLPAGGESDFPSYTHPEDLISRCASALGKGCSWTLSKVHFNLASPV